MRYINSFTLIDYVKSVRKRPFCNTNINSHTVTLQLNWFKFKYLIKNHVNEIKLFKKNLQNYIHHNYKYKIHYICTYKTSI